MVLTSLLLFMAIILTIGVLAELLIAHTSSPIPRYLCAGTWTLFYILNTIKVNTIVTIIIEVALLLLFVFFLFMEIKNRKKIEEATIQDKIRQSMEHYLAYLVKDIEGGIVNGKFSTQILGIKDIKVVVIADTVNIQIILENPDLIIGDKLDELMKSLSQVYHKNVKISLKKVKPENS